MIEAASPSEPVPSLPDATTQDFNSSPVASEQPFAMPDDASQSCEGTGNVIEAAASPNEAVPSQQCGEVEFKFNSSPVASDPPSAMPKKNECPETERSRRYACMCFCCMRD